ncbi:MAG: hypothetical protein HYV09_19730 [Deltaproteobacteria bacterium]|nr:hypothetical protein [Deltaproteobacteria bacterium]
MRRLLSSLGVIGLVVLSGCARESAPTPVSTSTEPVLTADPQIAATTPLGIEVLGRARELSRKLPGFLPEATIERVSLASDTMHIVARGARYERSVVRMALPRKADGALKVQAGAMELAVTPRGFSPSGIEWAEHVAIYPDVQPGTSALRLVAADGVEDFYQVDGAREVLSFSYDVALGNVAGLRVIDGNVEFLEQSGNPVLRMPRPIALDARGETRLGRLTVSGCAYDTKATGPWGRPVTKPGASTCTVVATIDGRGLSYPVLVDPAWQATTNTAKRSHAYHKLVRIEAGADSGKVLLVGGTGSEPGATELFNPTTGTWAIASSLPGTFTLGIGMNAVGLPSGRVVAAGGFPTTGTTSTAQGVTIVRDPTTGAWSTAATMTSRAWHAMVAVTVDGKEAALAIGGQPTTSYSSTTAPWKSAEYYFPVAPPPITDDSWVNAGNMTAGRTKGRAVVLGDGRVLVAGGESYGTSTTYLETAELYSPTTKTWSAAPSMATRRTQLELVALDGTAPRAIAAGGSTSNYASSAVTSLEYFDGTSWTTLTAKLSTPRWQFASARLDDGRILFTGGQSYNTTAYTHVNNTADIFIPGATPTTGTMTGAGSMSIERMFHAMANVPGTGALVVGGLAPSTETTSSEIFNTAIGGACGTGCAGGLTCVDGVCCTSTGCPEGQTCAAPGREGVCTKPKGATCTSNLECASGYCVTGVCCENACTGGCKACNEAGKEGTCTLAPVGADPGGFCTGTSDPTCGRKCNGTGSCSTVYAAEGTPCGSSLSDAGTGTFCSIQSCTSYGSCTTKTNNCGLTCTTTVTCNEATKTCTPTTSGIKAGFCVIANECWSYGDINPKDSCQVCDPPSSKTSWSTASSCLEGGVDTGTEEDTFVEDTGTEDTFREDTGTTSDTGSLDDTGSLEDAGEDASKGVGDDLPEASTCGCRVPGQGGSSEVFGALFALGLALTVAARRRRELDG